VKDFRLVFNSGATKIVERLAARNNLDRAEVVRRAINLLLFTEDEMAKGAKLLVMSREGQLSEILPMRQQQRVGSTA
jgi:hypothetical protein